MTIATRIDIETFNEQGYLVVENVLDPEHDLDPVVAEFAKHTADIWYSRTAAVQSMFVLYALLGLISLLLYRPLSAAVEAPAVPSTESKEG